MKERPCLSFVAYLWTLEGHPRPRREWSLPKKLREIADAGFHAVTYPASEELGKALADSRLGFQGFINSGDEQAFSRLVEAQCALGAKLINVQLQTSQDEIPNLIAKLQSLVNEAEKRGAIVSIESHRGTATETPERLYALADGYEKSTGQLLPITFDFSHIALVKHLKGRDFATRLLERTDLVQNSRLFHCRPFNGQHAQVPVYDHKGNLTREFREWLQFVEEVFRCWLAGPREGNHLWVCPEIGPTAGPHGYNLSTMPPSWPQALICKQQLAKLWRKLGGTVAKTR
jgi:hypothetical protein